LRLEGGGGGRPTAGDADPAEVPSRARTPACSRVRRIRRDGTPHGWAARDLRTAEKRRGVPGGGIDLESGGRWRTHPDRGPARCHGAEAARIVAALPHRGGTRAVLIARVRLHAPPCR